MAERVEFYSDTNLSERPKFSVRYQPFDSSLTLRAGYSDISCAQPLGFSRSAADGTPLGGGFFDPVRMEFVIPQVLEGGQPNLRPEVAYGYNYGAVWTPKFVRGLTLSVDFYHIDPRDRTNFFDAGFVVEHEDQFPGRVVRGPPDPDTLACPAGLFWLGD